MLDGRKYEYFLKWNGVREWILPTFEICGVKLSGFAAWEVIVMLMNLWEDNIRRSFMLCTFRRTLFRLSNEEDWGGQGM